MRRAFKQFSQMEASGGIVLFLAAFLAILLDNSFAHHYYQAFFNTAFPFQIGSFQLSKTFLDWINEGFMDFFFLLIGLEIKREMIEGELNSLKKAMLPAIAALGGMLVPALIFVGINFADPNTLRGWAIPTATDIAFSLAILALLGKRLPHNLKIFLTALAIFDDLGAIMIIAIYYTQHLSAVLILISAFLTFILFLMNRAGIVRLWAYLMVGFILWVFVLESGIHSTMAGIILAFAIPLKNRKNPENSPLKKMEAFLHPWVAYAVLPLFALANAGISLGEISFAQIFSPLPLAIMLGLFLGKQIGITGSTFLAVKQKWAQLPKNLGFFEIYGMSIIAGVGFTMSLFIGGLAFGYAADGYFSHVRLGVLVGSLLSGLTGFLILRYTYKRIQ